MAGSAVQLSSGLGGLFNQIGAKGTGTDLLMQQLGASTAGMFRPGVGNILDPDVLEAQAKQMAAAGDVQGALKMAGEARKARAEKQRQNKVIMDASDRTIQQGQARVAASQAGVDANMASLQQENIKRFAIKGLESKGMTQEADQIKQGIMSGEDGMKLLKTLASEGRAEAKETRGRDARTKIAKEAATLSDERAKARSEAAAERAVAKKIQADMEKTEKDRAEVNTAFRLLRQSDPPAYVRQMKKYGDIMEDFANADAAEVAIMHKTISRQGFSGKDPENPWVGSDSVVRTYVNKEYLDKVDKLVGSKNNGLEERNFWSPNSIKGFLLHLADATAALERAGRGRKDTVTAAAEAFAIMEEVALRKDVKDAQTLATEVRKVINDRVGYIPPGQEEAIAKEKAAAGETAPKPKPKAAGKPTVVREWKGEDGKRYRQLSDGTVQSPKT